MLDSFGHSETNAALFADFGFKYLLFSRASEDERKKMGKDKTLHFMWTPFAKNANTKKRELLTQFTHGKYQPLPDMQYDWKMNVEFPVVEAKDCKAIIELAQKSVGNQLHKRNVMLIHGDDFWYQRADINFYNLDVIIDDCNKIQKQNLKF